MVLDSNGLTKHWQELVGNIPSEHAYVWKRRRNQNERPMWMSRDPRIISGKNERQWLPETVGIAFEKHPWYPKVRPPPSRLAQKYMESGIDVQFSQQ